MTTETESPVVETVAPAPGAEVHDPLSLMGRKVVLKQDTDVMLGNILPAGAVGFVIRHPFAPDERQFDPALAGISARPVSRKWTKPITGSLAWKTSNSLNPRTPTACPWFT